MPGLTRGHGRPLTRTGSVMGILPRREFFIKPGFVQHISMPSSLRSPFLPGLESHRVDVGAKTQCAETVSPLLGLL
jgi:hypothetical protein